MYRLPNPLIHHNRLIALTRGQVCKVDSEDYEWLMKFTWFADYSECGDCFYAATNMRADEKRRVVRMHRLITDCPSGKQVDHADTDTLNNRRGNLRVCTHAENQRNRSANRLNTSGFKGVSLHRETGKWCAEIWLDNRKKYLGLFASKEMAHAAYMEASAELHGEFAHV